MKPVNVDAAYVPNASRRSCSVHERPMLATNSVQLGGWMSLPPPPATSASDAGDMGFSVPAGLAIRGLAVIGGWASVGRVAAAGVANGAVDDVS